MMDEGLRGGHAVMTSIDGRLAIGVVLINSIQLMGSLQDLSSEDARKLRNAWFGLADAASSIVGATLQMVEVAAKASVARKLGEAAVETTVGIHSLRISAAGLGVFAGVANMISQAMKAGDAQADGNRNVAIAYRLSSAAFVGTTYTSLLIAYGAYADRQVAKGVASAAMRRAALRFGARGAATFLSVGVTGWGLIFLGLGLLFEVGAVMMTPTQVQNWVRRTYFGKGPNKFKPGDWDAEFGALNALTQDLIKEKPQDSPADDSMTTTPLKA
jgi:hypothetical protein